ncbi:SAM-dependent methyltransferase [Primorskyibacter flagellatus]|uniref:SAM-dependent methyltransferase n=1 Tax=Primorskyibacter flagellatus TaxID=1387277 RepID=A0A917EF55_9RHOB|nr:class I SAM-dependent rRNA methyltransferase [Primorskyibacter flagellatus]GGE26247.1 SAM-dependent methyltransferase [Primorskyibacter flagellatus]
MIDLPTLRLKPKMDPRRLRHGYPWVYDNELVLDRRSKAIAPGSLAVLADADHTPIALVAANPGSRIAGRVLDVAGLTELTEDWFAARLTRALDLRERLYPDPFYRLVHAEADGFPGVVIDRFGDTCVVQPNAAWAEVHLDLLVAALRRVTGATNVLKSAGGRARGLEGLDDVDLVLAGSAPDAPVPVPMNGAVYMADLTGGQKTGLFFDQRPNHAFTAALAGGRRVLDVFSHVGGFALAALAAGAESALAVDGSQPALDLASEGATRSGVADRFSTRKGDAFDVLTTLGAEGETFGAVICDPPAFAPSKPALDAGLRAYERIARLAAPLVEPGGTLTLCSCSHAADLEKFRTACIRGIGRGLYQTGRSAQLIHTGFAGPDHPVHPQLAETGYLKALVFRL